MLLHRIDPSTPLNRFVVAVIGIGNTLAGDDGVGVLCVERLQERWANSTHVLLGSISGDLFGVTDIIDHADRIIFVDALAVDPTTRPGSIVRGANGTRAMAASLHQVDVATAMASLEALDIPVPPWEIWGITIEPPSELGAPLSPAVATAADRLTGELHILISSSVEEKNAT